MLGRYCTSCGSKLKRLFLTKKRATFLFELEWKSQKNAIIIQDMRRVSEIECSRREKVIELDTQERGLRLEAAKILLSQGGDMSIVLALLGMVGHANQLLSKQTEMQNLVSYREMDPAQIAAVRATPQAIADSVSNKFRPALLEAQIENKDAEIQRLATEAQESRERADGNQAKYEAALTKHRPQWFPSVTKQVCEICNRERVHKAGQCTVCGHKNAVAA